MHLLFRAPRRGGHVKEKQGVIREHVKDLMQRWMNEEQNELLRKGALLSMLRFASFAVLLAIFEQL